MGLLGPQRPGHTGLQGGGSGGDSAGQGCSACSPSLHPVPRCKKCSLVFRGLSCWVSPIFCMSPSVPAPCALMGLSPTLALQIQGRGSAVAHNPTSLCPNASPQLSTVVQRLQPWCRCAAHKRGGSACAGVQQCPARSMAVAHFSSLPPSFFICCSISYN